MAKFYKKKKRSKSERIGFYTSLSICIIAIGMAAYSTYMNFSDYMNVQQLPTTAAQVNKVATGVTEEVTQPLTETVTEVIVETTEPITEPEPEETQSALQTMLSVNTSLSYPLDNPNILKPYSEDTVYNKTLNQWNAHTGVDFKCNVGDNVYAMCDGEVTKIYSDDMLGNTIVISSSNYKVYYCGLSENANVKVGDAVKRGDAISLASVVPSEAMDESHIHIEVKVGDSYIDPLSVINNNE